MQQHPIPQNVTAYEFHLIGNMTIKQFVELGAGIGVGVMFYSTGLLPFIKWPLILLSVLGGVALAFMPFDGRPLDKMVIIFFQAIYSPTQFIWRKSAKYPRYFDYTPPKNQKIDKALMERQNLRKNIGEYLSTLPDTQKNLNLGDYDQTEANYLQNFSQLYQKTQAAANVKPGKDIVIPQENTLRVRPMKPAAEVQSNHPEPIENTLKSVTVSVPDNQPTAIPTATSSQTTKPASKTSVPPTQVEQQPQSSTQSKQFSSPQPTQTAQTNQDLPFPELPKQPNLLVGMVLSAEGRIISDAVIQIFDQSNTPVRAFKSNQLGQFFAASPLEPGNYQVVTQKPSFSFDTVSLKLNNKIVPPLEIRAQPDHAS